tara:strand:+ start:351 stop:578 length:228 start_codon:yes stop_codon:yes gene_type:complete
MPKLLGETFPYPRTGTQPDNSERLIPVANIPGGVNDIYLPENIRTHGGANDIYLPQVPRVPGGANTIYLKDNTPV